MLTYDMEKSLKVTKKYALNLENEKTARQHVK